MPGYVNDSGNLYPAGTPFTEGGTDPGNYATYDPDGGTDGIGSPYYRTQVGEWENSESPYGTFDQGGNVWEWNEAILYGSSRGFRGGSFTTDAPTPLHAANRSYYDYPTYEYYYIGFRVAEVSQFGACCLPDQTCGTHLTQGDCEAQGGTYAGDDTWCTCLGPVPVVSHIGMALLAVVVLGVGAFVLRSRQRVAA